MECEIAAVEKAHIKVFFGKCWWMTGPFIVTFTTYTQMFNPKPSEGCRLNQPVKGDDIKIVK